MNNKLKPEAGEETQARQNMRKKILIGAGRFNITKIRKRKKENKQRDTVFTDYRVYRYKSREVFKYAGIVIGISAVITYVFYDSVIMGIILGIPALLVFLKVNLKNAIEKRKHMLEKQFLTAAKLFGDYLRSGYSAENAITKSVCGLSEIWGDGSDIVKEWRQIAIQLRISRPLEEVFGDFGERSDIDAIRDFSEVFALVKRSGGGLSEVVLNVTRTLEERFSVEEQIQTMIAAKKLEQKIMDIMPAGILFYVKLTSPELMTPMYGTVSGILIMTVCVLMYAGAFLWGEKMIKIKV